jgi:hypothetical protein
MAVARIRVMNQRRLLFPLLAVLVAGVVWALWAAAQDPKLPEDGDPASGTTAAGAGTGVKANDGAPAGVGLPTSRETLAVTDTGREPEEYRRWLAGLRGRLIWQGSGEPIPNVRVQAVEAWLDTVAQSLDDIQGVLGAGDPLVLKGSGRTDADGNFEIPGVHSRAFLLLAIGLGTDKAAVRVVEHAPAPGELADLGDIALLERGTVAGQAVDADNKPVPGARVRIVDVSASLLLLGIQQYDPEGFVFLKQGSYHLVFEMPSWLRKYDKLLPFGDARTGADGKFVVTGVRPGRSTLMIIKKGLRTTTRTVRPQPLGRLDLGPIEVRSGATLEGSFKDADGKPVRGVRVAAGSLLNLAPFGFLGKPVAVSDTGKFAFSGLARGRLWLAYQRCKGGPWTLVGPYSDGSTVDLTLKNLRSATVTVENDRGAPIDTARFTLFVSDEAAWVPGYEKRIDATRHFKKDPERPGVWQVRNLPAAIYKVVAEAPGYALGTAALKVDATQGTNEGTNEGTDAQNVLVRLVPAHRQRFVVTNAAASPVAGARIYWNASKGRSDAAQFDKNKRAYLWSTPLLLGATDKDGNLETAGLEAGASRFLCRHPAYALGTSGEQVTQPGVPIRFVLGEGGHVEGSLTENGGQPQASHTLMAEPRGELKKRYGSLLMGRFTRSMPDGSFQFRHLDPGKWRIGILPDFGPDTSVTEFLPYGGSPFRSKVSRDVDITAGAKTFLHLEVSGASQGEGRGSLVGSVRIGGKPAKGARVETWSGGRRAFVDESGNFVLDGLPDGEHWIGVERGSRGRGRGMVMSRLWEGRVKIQNGGQQTLHLDVSAARVRIEVQDPKGNPLSGLVVELRGHLATHGRRQGLVRMQGITGTDGATVFVDVPEGRYRVRTESGREASWVFPRTHINVFASATTATQRIQAIPAIEITGTVEHDLSGLDEGGSKIAAGNRPTWLVFEDSGRFIWGPVRRHGNRYTFQIPGVAPGTYRFVSRGKLKWTARTRSR